MKRLLCLAALLIMLLTTVVEVGEASARPNYPFTDTLESGLARHHIIPWQELLNYGMKIDDKKKFVQEISGIETANLGSFSMVDPATGIRHQKLGEIAAALSKANPTEAGEAYEVYQSLLAWLPGNLVIGKQGRKDDPGDKFDQAAFSCMKSIIGNEQNPLVLAIGKWDKKDFGITQFRTLAKNTMTNAANVNTEACSTLKKN